MMEQPTQGFHVRSVHSIDDNALMAVSAKEGCETLEGVRKRSRSGPASGAPGQASLLEDKLRARSTSGEGQKATDHECPGPPTRHEMPCDTSFLVPDEQTFHLQFPPHG